MTRLKLRLDELVASSVEDAIKATSLDREAQRQLAIQRGLEAEIDRTTGSGDGKPDKRGDEDASVDPTQSGPHRGAPDAAKAPAAPGNPSNDKARVDAEAITAAVGR
jgi:hypothetical protein